MFSLFKKIADNEWFQTVILFIIILNALFLGLETYPWIIEQYNNIIVPVLVRSQILFVIEITIRVLAYWPRNYRNFFNDFWNRFDFTIVALSFLPDIWWFITIARIFRVLRILRIFSISDVLRNQLNSLKTTFSSVFIWLIIYLVLAYTLSITWFYLFWEIDTVHWWSLHNAFVSIVFMSLFQDLWIIFWTILKNYPGYIIFVILFYLTEATIIIKFLNITNKANGRTTNKK